MKRILSLILVAVLALSLFSGCGKPLTPESVVATVGKQEIYAYEMTYLMKMGATKEEALEELTTFKAMLQKAIDSDITLNDSDLKTIADDKAKMVEQYGSQEKVNELYAQLGLTEAQFDEISNMSYQVNKLNAKAPELNLIAEATDADIQTYYNEKFLRAKHILFKTVDDEGNPLSDEKVASVTKKAEETLAKIKDGKAFEDFANLSEDPGSQSAPDGYVFVNTTLFNENDQMIQILGQMGLPIMVDEFTQATNALAIDQVSELVSSEYGIHIIKKLDLAGDAATYESMKEQLRAGINNIRYTEAIEAWKKEYKVKVKQKVYDALETPEPYQPQAVVPEEAQVPEEVTE